MANALSGQWVVRELDDLIAKRRAPKMIVGDSGTEPAANAVLAGSSLVGIE